MLTWIRRIMRHLWRTQAKTGWVICLLTFGLFQLYPDDWAGRTTVAEVSLILFSIALGAIFLPELSASLWKVSAEEARELIPPDKARQLRNNLVRAAVSEDEWAEHVVGAAVEPLLRIGEEEPHRIVGDLSYTANIHMAQSICYGERTRVVNRVEVNLRGRRVLPNPDRHAVHWISVARTSEDLAGEFRETGCLFRELVDLDEDMSPEEWRKAVEANTTARILINGRTVEAQAETPNSPKTPENVVRWYFEAAELELAARAGTRSTVTLALDYPLAENCLDVIFGNYFVMGSANVLVRVYGGSDSLELSSQSFFGRSPRENDMDVTETVKPGLCSQVNIVTDDRILIWPGSGLRVSWRKVSDLVGA